MKISRVSPLSLACVWATYGDPSVLLQEASGTVGDEPKYQMLLKQESGMFPCTQVRGHGLNKIRPMVTAIRKTNIEGFEGFSTIAVVDSHADEERCLVEPNCVAESLDYLKGPQ